MQSLLICPMAELGTTDCSWDTVIPFEPLWVNYKRLIKRAGAVVLFGSQPFTTDLINSNRDWFKYELNWVNESRPTGFVHAKNKPLTTHENILIFSNGAVAHAELSTNRMTYNPQFTDGESYIKKQVASSTKFGTITGKRPSHKDYILRNTGYRYPTSTLNFREGNNNNYHPTQKPVALLAYLIRTYTNPGELILDNTMGSGTTGAACAMEDRRFVGIEINEAYCEIAAKRIDEILNQPRLFTINEKSQAEYSTQPPEQKRLWDE